MKASLILWLKMNESGGCRETMNITEMSRDDLIRFIADALSGFPFKSDERRGLP